MNNKPLKYSASLAMLVTMMQTTPVFASPVTKEQIHTSQEQIRSTQLQMENLDTTIQQLDDKISVSMDRRQKLHEEIKTLQGKMEEAKKEIEEAEKSLNAHKAIYSERLRSMQMQGEQPILTYAEILFSSQSVSDFVGRVTTLSAILQSDSGIMSHLKEKEQELTETKEKLDSQLKDLKSKQGELASEQATIEKSKQEIRKQLAMLNSTLAKQKKQLAQQQTQLKEQEQARLKTQKEAQLKEQQARLKAQQEAELREQQAQFTQPSPSTFTAPKTQPSFADVPHLTYSSDKATKVIAYAKQFMGVPYVWGGTTPSGFDCSGFTSYVFRHVDGIELPRVARDQQDVGQSISLSQVQPGDLVFKGNPAYHVGIYIGGGKYIHAPRTGDVVKISNYNPSSFTTASRILSE